MLEPASILIVTVISAFMSMGVLGALLRAGIPGVRWWFAGSLLAVVALGLFALQRMGYPALTILGANQMLALALLMILQGCRQFAGVAWFRWWEYVVWLLLLPALWYWTYREPDVNYRIALVSAFHAYVYFSVGVLGYRMRPPGKFHYAYRFVCVTAIIGGFGHATRGILYGVGWASQETLMEATPINIIFLGLGVLALPALSIGMVMLAHDRLVEKLERMASVDELTGILVRRSSLERAEAELRTALRSGRKLSLAFLDIDHFKRINDAYGHAAGDRVLAHFAGLISSSLRSSDVFGRLGGEEFIIVCPETSKEEAVRVLERMQRLIANVPCEYAGRSMTYTFSAGVGEYCAGESLPALMSRTDEALYVAKALGRDRITVAAPVSRVGRPADPGRDTVMPR